MAGAAKLVDVFRGIPGFRVVCLIGVDLPE